jgi:hypothetical protein
MGGGFEATQDAVVATVVCMTIPPPNFKRRNRDPRLRSTKHLAFLRKRLCCAYMRQECEGKVEASHLRNLAPEYGMGIKPSDLWAVGACRFHHRMMEGRDDNFALDYDIDLLKLAIEYACVSEDKIVSITGQAITAMFTESNPMTGEKLRGLGKEIEQIIKAVRERATA